MPSENNKRIAKNTIVLYLRMMVTMAISFFTTRVVLNTLGVVDYGLVNVIGSAVSMFSFLSISLSTAASRFFNYELGKKDAIELRRTFSMVLLLYGGLFVILLLLSDTVGLWVVKTKLTIPPERVSAANLFFHLSVISLLIGVWAVPYQAMVISHENMRAYAWLSIFEAVAKLGIVFCLTLGTVDRLKLYGCLFCFATLLHTLLYKVLCHVKYPETRFIAYVDKRKFRELLSFSGWNLFGTAAWATSDVFVSLLLNNFFGPVVNAARGVAMQVSGGVSAFTQNFLTAARPQIVKYWAANERDHFHVLIHRTAKTGFFLLLFLSLPVLIETEFILRVWLKTLPAYAVSFTQLVVLTGLVNSFSFPIVYAAQATGKIALFEGIGSGMRFLVLPGAWVALVAGGRPETALWVVFAGTVACMIARLVILARITGSPAKVFAVKAVLPCVLVALVAGIAPLAVRHAMGGGWLRFFAVGGVSVVSTALAVLALGLNRSERGILADVAARAVDRGWNRIAELSGI
jgi:O-antigen/teichoic acid export membrane protein